MNVCVYVLQFGNVFDEKGSIPFDDAPICILLSFIEGEVGGREDLKKGRSAEERMEKNFTISHILGTQ